MQLYKNTLFTEVDPVERVLLISQETLSYNTPMKSEVLLGMRIRAKEKSVAMHYSSASLMPSAKQCLNMLCGILDSVGNAFLIDLSLINRDMRRMLHKVSL